MQETWIWSLGQEDPWRKEWQPAPVFLPRESHGQRSLVGYSPWVCKESDMTEHVHIYEFHIYTLNQLQVKDIPHPQNSKKFQKAKVEFVRQKLLT